MTRRCVDPPSAQQRKCTIADEKTTKNQLYNGSNHIEYKSMSGEIHKVPIDRLLAYGSLSFPLAAAFITLQVIVPTHYAGSVGISLSTTGLVLVLARLWDMFTDPVVGYLSDRTPASWGKRRFWVLLGAPAIAVSTWFLFNPPPDAGAGYLLIWTLAIYVSGTMAIVPMNAWGAELSPDYLERGRITSIRAFFGLAGTLVALLIAALANSADGDMSGTLRLLAIMVAATLAITIIWSSLKVPDHGKSSLSDNSFKDALALVKQPSPFRTLLISFLLNNIGNAIPATLFILYVTHVLAAPDKAGPLLFLYFSCAGISVPIWLRLAKRFGKHQTWIAAVLLACISFIWTPLLGPDLLWVFVVIVAITGFATSADLILPSAVMGDLIEWDTLQTGYQRPGIFFALWGTTTKLGFALAIGLAFPLLDLAGFSATDTNSSNSILVLAIFYGLPCIGFKLGAAYLMRNYPIDQAEHDRIRIAIKQNQLATQT